MPNQTGNSNFSLEDSDFTLGNYTASTDDMTGNDIQKEKFAMSDSQSSIKFKETKGFFISRATAVLLVLLVLAALAAVGLIVAYTGKPLSKCATTDMSTTLEPEPESTTEPTPEPPTRDVRIPGDLLPVHYNVELRPNLDPSVFTFDGYVEILIECKNATSEIILHSNKLTVSNYTLSVATPGYDVPTIRNMEFDTSVEFLIFTLNAYLQPEMRYWVRMNFEGELADDLAGLYRSSYKTSTGETRWLATSQMQPTDTRKTFPCYDEPALKATFKVTIVRWSNMTSITNMELVSSESREDGWVADHFATSVKMPTYLLAFMVCDFSKKTDTSQNGTVEVNAWARSEAVDQVDYALNASALLLDYYTDYFGISYPLNKSDSVAVPDFAAGAMENWGLVLYRETALLYEPGVSSESNKKRVLVVVSHELAHQWFGNLVSPAWWDDLWLNEGFASYVEYIGIDHIEPEWQSKNQFVVDDLQTVMVLDALGTSHPIYLPVYHPDEINEIFDAISYQKGASIIRMMNFFLGESTFKRGLYNYLVAYSYGNARTPDLWAYLTDQAVEDGLNIDVGEVMDTWTLQMGFPMITLSRSWGADPTITATQQHFLLDPNATVSDKYQSPFNYVWRVPFTLTSADAPEWDNPSIQWINTESQQLELPSAQLLDTDWLIGNVGVFGYYRVNYDDRTWGHLNTQLNIDHTVIPSKNRAQLIDDALSIARAGHYSMVNALKITEYLSKEQDYLPWRSAVNNMNYVRSMLARTGAYGDFKQYMLTKVTPLYEHLGWNDDDKNPQLETFNRILAISTACRYGHDGCTTTASEQYKQWMENPDNNPISPNFKTIVYCMAIAVGEDAAEWDFAWEQYLKANVASEKSKLLYSMSCSQQIWILQRYLHRALEETDIKRQDADWVIGDVAKNPIGRYLAWDFVRANWDIIFERFGKSFFSMRSLIQDLTKSFNTEFELEQLKSFVSDITAKGQVGTGERAWSQAIEQTQANIYWMEANLQGITDWLSDL